MIEHPVPPRPHIPKFAIVSELEKSKVAVEIEALQDGGVQTKQREQAPH